MRETNPRKGERGLAQMPITIWIHDGSLKIEHQAVTLSQYSVELQDDRKHVQKVGNPRLVETPFRSSQLTLFDLRPGEWVLYWRAPDYAPARRKPRIEGLVQPLLFDLPLSEKAVGGNQTSVNPSPRRRLHVVPKPSDGE